MDVLIALIICVALYFLPSIIAVVRDHKNLMGIALLNLFLGWTLLFWVGALVWAVLDGQKAKALPL